MPTSGGRALRVLEAGDGPLDVTLAHAGLKKIAVIKVIRAYTRLGLKEAKLLVDTAPSTVLRGVTEEDAERFRIDIETAGGAVDFEARQTATNDRASSAEPAEEPAKSPTSELAEELERLATLHERGALNDEEFAVAKARVLGNRPG